MPRKKASSSNVRADAQTTATPSKNGASAAASSNGTGNGKADTPSKPKRRSSTKSKTSTTSNGNGNGNGSSSNGKAKANGNGKAKDEVSEEQVAQAKEQHSILKSAQKKHWKHAYLSPDLKDPQIVGGNKETALIHYNPGIVISETGRKTDKKLDEHESWEFGGPWGVTAMMTLFPVLMYYLWICEYITEGERHARPKLLLTPWAMTVFPLQASGFTMASSLCQSPSMQSSLSWPRWDSTSTRTLSQPSERSPATGV